MQVVERRIDIRPLKRLAIKSLPPNSPLREVLLQEKDEIDASEYIVKVDVWLKLLRGAFR